MSAAGSSRLGIVGRLKRELDPPGASGPGAGRRAGHRRSGSARSGSARSGSISRKQVRTGPGGSCAASCHAPQRERQLRGRTVSPRPTSSAPLSAASASAQRSASGFCAPAGPPRSNAKPATARSRARTAASVSSSSAAVTMAADCSPSTLLDRHSGGMAPVSSRAAERVRTRQHRPPSCRRKCHHLPVSRPGRTRPRTVRSAASAASAAR